MVFSSEFQECPGFSHENSLPEISTSTRNPETLDRHTPANCPRDRAPKLPTNLEQFYKMGGPDVCGSGSRVQGSCKHTEHVAMYEPHLNPGGPNLCDSGSRVQGRCKHTEHVAMYDPQVNPPKH